LCAESKRLFALPPGKSQRAVPISAWNRESPQKT
jgi:hypothetical protein